MIDRPRPSASLANRARSDLFTAGSEVVRWSWALARSLGATGPRSRLARQFGSFGEGSIICFPYEAVVNPSAIHIGSATMINTGAVLSAGWYPDQPDLGPRVVSIGDRSLIGRNSSVVGHLCIEIGDDVWTGQNVHITDMNHGYTDLEVPISRQSQPEAPVSIGDGSWLGHNVVVLPGSTIGRHVAVGAGSVVRGTLPDHCVAAGVPARVIRRYDPDGGWGRTGAGSEPRGQDGLHEMGPGLGESLLEGDDELI